MIVLCIFIIKREFSQHYKVRLRKFTLVKRSLLLSIFYAFALFFLLLTGENTLHSQKASQQDNTSIELITEYLVSQHTLKATSEVKEANLTETNITRPFLGASGVLETASWWQNIENHYELLQVTHFVPDKRKAISLLLYPFHYFW